jgi:hypothetical protein
MKNKRSRPPVRKSGDFDAGLRQRAAAFLTQPIPAELQPDYVADSLADRLIAACARNDGVDPELLEIAELACGEYDDFIAGARTEELRDYYTKSRDLLADIVEAGRRLT